MSIQLFRFAKSFTDERMSAEVFAPAFIELWRIEREDGSLLRDEAGLSVCLSGVFCLADLFNPDDAREEHELGEDQLREEVAMMVDAFDGLPA